MFLEKLSSHSTRKGWIEVICGSMFSGKTEELIRRLKRAQIAKLKVEIFKPQIDHRYDDHHVVSHDKNAIPSTSVPASSNILLLADQMDVVGIDEAQFFDSEIVNVCNQLANQGVRVIVAGLDMDYQGQPFGAMPALLAQAEYITKVHAICVDCGDLAQHSFRIATNDALVVIGEKEKYKPVCRNCFNSKNDDRPTKEGSS